MAKARIKTTTKIIKYRPEYCQEVVEHMAQGLSFNTFAGKIGVGRDALYEWVNKYPEFAIAKDRAFAARAEFFERKMIEGITQGVKMGAAPLLIFALKNLGDGYNFTDKHVQQIESNKEIALIPVFGTHDEAQEGA